MLTNLDNKLLLALRAGKHFKANPGDVIELLILHLDRSESDEMRANEAKASARRVVSEGLAVFVPNKEEPDKPFLRITDQGMAYADILAEAVREKSLLEHIKTMSRSDWIALGAVLVSLVALFKD